MLNPFEIRNFTDIITRVCRKNVVRLHSHGHEILSSAKTFSSATYFWLTKSGCHDIVIQHESI